MAKDGPFMTAAMFCEHILEDKDGTLSAIRIVDRVTQTATGPGAPKDMPPMAIKLWMLITLRSGAARGRRTVSIRPESPSGQQSPAIELPVLFEGEDRGQNFRTQIGFVAEHEGLYWFDVLLEDDLLTRVPLRVVYRPMPS
jgi:hypothetical protein